MAWKLAGWILWGRISRRYEDWKYTSCNFVPKSSTRRKNRKFIQYTCLMPFPTVEWITLFVNIIIALLALCFKTLWNPKSFANSTTRSQLHSEDLEIFKHSLYEYFFPWGRIKHWNLLTRYSYKKWFLFLVHNMLIILLLLQMQSSSLIKVDGFKGQMVPGHKFRGIFIRNPIRPFRVRQEPCEFYITNIILLVLCPRQSCCLTFSQK